MTWLQNHFIILLVKFVCLSCDFYSANSANSCHFLSILANSANSLFFHPANSLFFILYFIILPILYSFIPFISNMKSPCDVWPLRLGPCIKRVCYRSRGQGHMLDPPQSPESTSTTLPSKRAATSTAASCKPRRGRFGLSTSLWPTTQAHAQPPNPESWTLNPEP